MKLRFPLLLAASVVVSLSACSSSSDAADEEPPPAAGSDAGGESADPSESPSADPSVPMGQAATYKSSTLSLKVRVAKANCGLSEVENAQFNDDWDGTDDANMNVSYEAPEGKELCAITLSISNVGDDPAEPPYPAGRITLEDGTSHSRSVEDETASDTATDSLTKDSDDIPSYDPLNPGDTRDYMYVVSVPKGAKAKSLSYPDEDRVLKTTQDPLVLSLT